MVQGEQIAALLKERVTFLKQMTDVDYLFNSPNDFDAKTVKKKWKENTPELMSELRSRLADLREWDRDSIESVFSTMMAEKEVGFGQLGPGWRLLLTGQGGGPGLFDIAAFIGKEETLGRMENNSNAIAAQKAMV